MEFSSFDALVAAYAASDDQPRFLRRLQGKTTRAGYRSLLKQILNSLT